jgi:outer membrane lipoprotein-sorting protein
LIFRLVFYICLALFSTHSQSDVDAWPLATAVTAKGVFSQVLTDSSGATLVETRGTFSTVKPDLYRWEIESPDRQLLLLNGDGFWQWDKDLDIVVLRDRPNLEDLPLARIWEGNSGHAGSIGLSDTALPSGIERITLIATAADTIEIRLTDALDQETFISLRLIESSNLSPSDFTFAFPDGAEFYNESSTAAPSITLETTP